MLKKKSEDKIFGLFNSSISHEILTPLNTISTMNILMI